MHDLAVYAERRRRLRERIGGPILLLGNGERTRNLPMNPLPFRQDSNFLYFIGVNQPHAAALLNDDGCSLFLPEPGPDDALWHGPAPSRDPARFGVDVVLGRDTLDSALAGLSAKTLAVADEQVNQAASATLGVPLRFGVHHGDDELVRAVIELRRVKGPEEITAMRQAGVHSVAAHVAAMRATRPGVTERSLTALFEATLAARGCTTAYPTILTQRGEVLHNFHHDGVLESGKLLLLDGGGEPLASGYAADITRTWPVSGRFTPRQRAAYGAVLEAQRACIEACTVGRPYRQVHDLSSHVLASWLADEGLLRCSADDAVATGAHALFYPHGVGHLIGLDVHDLENYGDQPAYAPNATRPDQFGTANLRLDLPLEAGWVVTIEPGFYVVPAILADPTLRDRFATLVDFDRAESWLGFGGIRIEDDVHITPDGPVLLTPGLAKEPDAIEAIIGTGPMLEWHR